MGVQTNRMLPRTITINNATATTIIGAGREGVMNGGSTWTATITVPAGLPGVVVTIHRRAVRGGALSADATTYTLTANKANQIVLTPAAINQYEIQATAQGENTDIVVDLSIQRAG